MCAITGAPTLRKAFSLYENGLERGHFSSGLIVICENDSIIVKQQAPFKYETIEEHTSGRDDIIYYALHSRAPTNTVVGEWNYDSTHPFDFDCYYVAHNGIINNFNQFPEHVEFEVDSSIIPYHLHVNNGDIVKTYTQYEGLLTSWLFEITEHKLNVVKAGSSLFIDKDSFSSVRFPGSVCVETDGVIFELGNDRCLHEVGGFEYSSPYFIL